MNDTLGYNWSSIDSFVDKMHRAAGDFCAVFDRLCAGERAFTAGADIAYDRPPVPGLEQHIWVLDGALEMTVRGVRHRLLRAQVHHADLGRRAGHVSANDEIWIEDGELCADPSTVPTFFLDGGDGADTLEVDPQRANTLYQGYFANLNKKLGQGDCEVISRYTTPALPPLP